MAERANVTAVEALEAFRAQLIVYLSKARPALEEVSADVVRMRTWLENDQRVHWEQQLRRRGRELEQAQQALFSARISNLRDERVAEVLAVRRAKASLEEAEAKLKTVKLWNRDFDNRVLPLSKQVEKLQTVLANDMPQAIAYLGQAVRSLDAYAEVRPSDPSTGSVSGSPSTGGSAASGAPDS